MHPIKLCSGWLASTIHNINITETDNVTSQKGQPKIPPSKSVWAVLLTSFRRCSMIRRDAETYWPLYSRSVWLNIHCYTCRCLLSTAIDCSHVFFNRFSQGHIVINNNLPVHTLSNVVWHWPFTDSTVFVPQRVMPLRPEQYRILFEWLLFSPLLSRLPWININIFFQLFILFNCCLLLLSARLDVCWFLCFSYSCECGIKTHFPWRGD